MLVDNITITLKAGDGGKGAATFSHTAMTEYGGPDGGNGGNGGSIYAQGTTNLNDLREFRYKKKVVAENGIPGKHFKLNGKNAPHITILVPLGTRITNTNTHKELEIVDTTAHLLVRGGIGGKGNVEFKTATQRTPLMAENGMPGEAIEVFLELRLIADVGLIGLPNAGKSSLLAVLTEAHPKIAAYPFTTLEPNIGMLGRLAIADIPGLIAGASMGKGLGMTFLKHIEKTKLLLHCIDVSGKDLLNDYETIRKEFKVYSNELLAKPEIILLTKTDLTSEEQLKKAIALFKKNHPHIWTVSVLDDESITALKQNLLKSK